MKAAPVICLVVLLAQGASAQTVSYWFQGWQSKPDAKQAAAYFMVPGANVTFTYQTNRVIINSAGGGPGGNLQLFGDVTSPLTALPNVTATLKNTGTAGTYVKTTFDAQGRETSGVTTLGNADLVNSAVTYNGVTVSLGASGTLLLSGVGGDFLNEGTTTTVLHGNAAGTLSFGAVDLVNDVTGNLGVTHLNSGIGAAVGTFWQGDGTWAAPTTAPTGLVTNQFTTNTTVLISQFQPSCINLTQWCGVSTNDFFLSVTQYVRDATNGLGGTGVTGLVTNEFTTNPAVAISQFQPACGNLSNWCLLSTNFIVDLMTNDVFYATNTIASNILDTVSNSIYTTSNSIITIGTPNVVFNNAGTTNYAGFGAAAGNVAGGANTAVGYQANAQGATFGAGSAFGYQSKGYDAGTAVGYQADANNIGTAVGVQANGSSDGVAVGYTATASTKGAAVGREATAGPQGVAVGYQATGTAFGAGLGYQANGADGGAAVGYLTDGSHFGVSIGAHSVAEGNGSVAIGGDNTGANKAQVTIGWNDTIELGRGNAPLQGGLNFRGMGIMDSSANAFSSTLTATNGIIQQMYKTNGTLICVTNKQFYLVYGTNELITLPNASLATVSNIIYRFSTTNGYGSFIITNATGTQTIRDGVSLSYTNIGINEVGFVSDGANWWLASKGKQIFPSASWSLSSNITLAQDTITNIPFSDLEFNNSQGIALKTNATFSRPTQLWVTNSGTYMITFSAVLRGPAGGGTISLWLRKGGADVARTRTDQIFAGTTSQVTMTVNFFQNLAAPDFFEIVAASHNATPPTIESGTANPTGYTAPAMPSIIVTINRVSDTWP